MQFYYQEQTDNITAINGIEGLVEELGRTYMTL